MDKLKWIFELGDKFSGPLKKMQRGLDAFQGSVKKTKSEGKGGDLLGGSALATAGALGAAYAAASLLSSGLASVVSMAGRAASALGGATYEAGKFAFEAGAFKESSLAGLKTVLGSDKEAKKFFDGLVDFSLKSGVDAREFVKAGKNLRAFGLDEQDTMALLKAGGDLSAFSGGGREATSLIFRAFGQIKAKDKLAAEELVGQLAEQGLSSAKVYELAAKKYNISIEEATKRFQTGKIKASEGLFFVTEAIKQTASGGRLGSLMEAQSKTAQGLLDSLSGRAEALFFDFNETDGYSAFKGFLENANKALDPKTGPGARVKKAANELMSDIFGATFSGLAGAGGDEFIANFAVGAIKALGTLFKSIKSFFSTVGGAFDRFFSALGGGDAGKGIEVFLDMIARGLSAIIALAEKLVGKITPFFDLLDPSSAASKGAGEFFDKVSSVGSAIGWFDVSGSRAGFDSELAAAKAGGAAVASARAAALAAAPEIRLGWEDVGSYAGQGLIAGLLGQRAAVLLAGQGLASAAVEGARVALDVNSPSRVFEQLGIYSTAGYARGLWGGAAEVGETAAAVFTPDPSLGALGASAAGGARGNAPPVSVVINVDASGTSDDLAARVKAATVEGLAEAFETLGLELGVQPS